MSTLSIDVKPSPSFGWTNRCTEVKETVACVKSNTYLELKPAFTSLHSHSFTPAPLSRSTESFSFTGVRAEQWKHTFLPWILVRNPIRVFYSPTFSSIVCPPFFYFIVSSIVAGVSWVSVSICCEGKLISVLSLHVPLCLFLLSSHFISVSTNTYFPSEGLRVKENPSSSPLFLPVFLPRQRTS